MNCTELASKLTENYYTSETYDASNSNESSLNEYMNHNGILLTMCIGMSFFPKIFGGPCKLGIRENHLSASWIRNIDTGFRIFGMPDDPDALPIGLVLDPLQSHIDCMYPIDAVTDTRLRNGCGPVPDAPDAPPFNFMRILERIHVVNYKNENFGNDTKWMDIDCMDFMEPMVIPEDTGNFAVGKTDCKVDFLNNGTDMPFRFETSGEYIYNTWSSVMGHPVCNQSLPWSNPTFHDIDTILYFGSCIWKPNNWVGMMDIMEQIAVLHPKVHFWNEIVITKPNSKLEEMVQAVFVLDGSSPTQYETARFEAQKMGKPLLILHHNPPDQNVSFSCDGEYSTARK
jgi:hypothetical protein